MKIKIEEQANGKKFAFHKQHYISFCPSKEAIRPDSTYGETALVCGARYKILNGNHFDKMKLLSLKEALEYFRLNIHLKSSWSI